jgi:hypothetical protein
MDVGENIVQPRLSLGAPKRGISFTGQEYCRFDAGREKQAPQQTDDPVGGRLLAHLGHHASDNSAGFANDANSAFGTFQEISNWQHFWKCEESVAEKIGSKLHNHRSMYGVYLAARLDHGPMVRQIRSQ